ncbi:hypothetical protein [Pelagicoccus sp. SDUM812003]|uniref:YncE family protein n=1 Tax=Pelagicoccus sp. SDUM812003 TaxID=3041267 RepID=UPI00280E18C8|nr:hypothetical protein [Pelagicoccus sp. SDUM812003]MDQ8202095.1 hypothetical protein [Pelagicoccus sp. SDUM812003]
MTLRNKGTYLLKLGIPLALGAYTLGLEVGTFPASNAPARIPQMEDADVGESSNPSLFGLLTSEVWSYGREFARRNLQPVGNPNPNPEPQPRRDHPSDVALSQDGSKAYLTLQGSEYEPGSEIAVVDIAQRRVIKRIPIQGPSTQDAASSPIRLIEHPDERYLLVVNRFSNFAAVLDTQSDRFVDEIALDYYCQDGSFSKDGETLYLANRYLDQVFLVDAKASASDIEARMRVLGGLDDKAFFSESEMGPSIHGILNQSCATTGCHDAMRGGFYAGPDQMKSFLSALEHIVPGDAKQSRLLTAALPGRVGGYADMTPKYQSHALGTVVFPEPETDERLKQLTEWIDAGGTGPGIPVGNQRSKPVATALSDDERYLFVGNTGTQDISIVDTASQQEVGAIYLQNAVNDLAVYHSDETGRDYLIVSTMGIGFGVTKERDPFGGESWDPENPAAQYTVWRDPSTGLPLPREQQEILGPFDAVDGTLEIKFRDIQNDIVFIDISALDIPEADSQEGLRHILKVNKYEAHRAWVRYTSDSAESTYGDIKGDIPPALMRVVGAFPDRLAIDGDRLFVSMQGSNQVQQWRINPTASDPIDYLVPEAVYPTGFMPKGIKEGKAGTVSENKLLTANFLGGSLSLIDRESGSSYEIPVDPSLLRLPVPATNAERGEIMAHTSFYSSDGDTSCLHCHTRDMSDGRSWGVSQVLGQEFLDAEAQSGPIMIGGAMNVPQMRGLFAIQPFFFEGVISGYEPRSMMLEHCPSDDFRALSPQGDFTKVAAHYTMSGQDDIQSKMDTTTAYEVDLEERRDEMFRTLSRQQFGKSFNLRDFQRFIGEWQMHEPRLLPNPYDHQHPSIKRGQLVFEDPQVGCVSCHPAPSFAKKDFPNNPQQAIPPVTMFTVRDGSFTLLSKNREDYNNGKRRDLEPWDQGRMEAKQGHLTTFPLRGIWDRPASFLHNGLARNLREVSLTPGHPALGTFKYEPLFGGYPERPDKKEVGFNMTFLFATAEDRVKMHLISESRLGFDTHGGTSHLTRQEIDDLVNFMNSIE